MIAVQASSRKRKPVDAAIPAVMRQKRNKITSQFLVDGASPITPYPQLAANRNDTITSISRPGRRRSVDIGGLILQLIEEAYPPLICPGCFETSSRRAEADQHLKLKHHGQKVFKCIALNCKQVYSSKAGLRYHLEHAHQISRNNQSSSTNKKIDRQQAKVAPTTTKSMDSEKQELSTHLQQRLNQVYPVTVCPACNQEFKKKTHVIAHLAESHHGEEPYKCVVSDCERIKNYGTRGGLVYHLISYHDQSHKQEK